MQIRSPFGLDRHGQVALADEAAHIRQMIEQLLFTAPGERVNRPDFGCGLDALVFETMNSEMIGVTQALIRGALQRWLGDIIHVEKLDVAPEGERLCITITYGMLTGGGRRTETFVA